MDQKRILVIGGTGAQGFAVVKALVEAKELFVVRVLSRNPVLRSRSEGFQELPSSGVLQGFFHGL
jgi:uncharacterized protein YbjT (DUF2867 family)